MKVPTSIYKDPMINREDLKATIRTAIRRAQVTTVLGSRQCGKTTIARELGFEAKAEFFDLEDPVSRKRLEEPMTALAGLKGLVVIDEAQRLPALFPVLRVLSDRTPLPARFLLTGSASPDLIRGVSETLAGRVEFIEMSGFNLLEVGPEALRRLWWRGGLPRAYLARTNDDCRSWQEAFVRTFLERDLRMMGIDAPPIRMRKLWTMVAHYHGGTWNASDVARSLGVSPPTAQHYLDILAGSFAVRQLQPWHDNLEKRQRKAPKVFVRDSGLLHALLGLRTFRELEGHPRLGFSWEGFVIEEIIKLVGERQAYSWGTHSGAELDLLVFHRGKRYGVEVKYADAPGTTKSMHSAIDDLKLDQLFIAYPGTKAYELKRGVQVLPLPELLDRFRKPTKRAPGG